MKSNNARFNTLVAGLTLGLVFLWDTPQQTGAAEATLTLTDRIMQANTFSERLLWVGDEAPGAAESQELWVALEFIRTNRLDAGIQQAEAFLQAHPQSSWAASLHANLGFYYRQFGRYTRALDHWQQAWDATKGSSTDNGKSVADFTLAHWSRLLSNLGRADTLRAIHQATEGRHLERQEWERLFSASRQTRQTMEQQPGVSYRCGTYALIQIAPLLPGAGLDIEAVTELPSPEAGFSLARLVDI